MRVTTDLENPNRRRHHLVAGTIICIALYVVVVVAVRVTIGS